MSDVLEFARSALDAEADAIRSIVLDQRFTDATELILSTLHGELGNIGVVGARGSGGALIVSGLGKSGLIGQKLAATFASTGTPSHFVHPVEAMHGDLGAIRRGDVVLVLSYSGNTEEVVALVEILRQDGVAVIAIVGGSAGTSGGEGEGASGGASGGSGGSGGSDLARIATVALPVGDVTEACPHNLAPTASTTAMLALGDALALSVSRRRKFGADDFQKVHPGGGLGKLLLPIRSAMRFKTGENLTLVDEKMTLADAYHAAQMVDAKASMGGEQTCEQTGEAKTNKTDASGPIRRAGALVVVDDAGKLSGIFTDGDLRRLIFDDPVNATTRQIGEVMVKNPRHLQTHHLVRDAARMIREFRIDEVPVVDENGKPIGLIDVQDMVALKVIQG